MTCGWGATIFTVFVVSCAPGGTETKISQGNLDGPVRATRVRAALALGNHTCLLHVGEVSCWGRGTEGQTTVPALRNPTQVTVGDLHTCALDDDGVKCWGYNGS